MLIPSDLGVCGPRGDRTHDPRIKRPFVNREQFFTEAASEGAAARLRRQENRQRRMKLRADVRQWMPTKSTRSCGMRACSASGVGVRLTETADGGRRAGFSGLSTCDSVWVCPVCAAKIAAHRADELAAVMRNAQGAGCQLALVTLTVRHKASDALVEVWRAIAIGWGRVTSGKGWLADKTRYGIAGWARAVEATHGRAGWHLHVHAVVAYRGSVRDAEALGQSMYTRWDAGLRKAGFTSLPGYGGDVEVSRGGLGQLGRHLSKLGADLDGLSREVTSGNHKRARGTNRTPFQIARDAATTGNERDIAIWREWCQTAPGHRALTWSKGFREQFGLEDERSDEAIAGEELGTVDDTIVLLPPQTWRAVRARPWEPLNIAERDGAAGLTAWLEDRGLVWQAPPQRQRREQPTTEQRREAMRRDYAAIHDGIAHRG